MNRFAASVVVAVAALLVGAAAAHTTEMELEFRVQGREVRVLASSVEGYPVTGAKLEAILSSGSGPGAELALREARPNSGEYVAPAPDLPAGAYTLTARDRTYRQETSDVSVPVSWPFREPARITLPATQGGLSIGVLIALAAGPVVLAAAFAVWAIVARPGERRRGAGGEGGA